MTQITNILIILKHILIILIKMIINKYRERNDYNDPTFGLVSFKNVFDTKNMCHSNPNFKNNHSNKKKIRNSLTPKYSNWNNQNKLNYSNMLTMKRNSQKPTQHVLYRKKLNNKKSTIFIYKKKYQKSNSLKSENNKKNKNYLKTVSSSNQVSYDYNSKTNKNGKRSPRLDSISYSSNSKTIFQTKTKINGKNLKKNIKSSLNCLNNLSAKYKTEKKNFNKKEDCTLDTQSSNLNITLLRTPQNPRIVVLKPLHKNFKSIQKNKNLDLFENAIKDGIRLRRLQYNEYLKKREILKKETKKKQIEKNKANKIKEIKEKINVLEEMNKIINIQKYFEGFKVRTINQSVNCLKARTCFCEVFCLLLVQIYNFYYKKLLFEKMKNEYHIPFSGISKETNFNDKMDFRLMSSYYNSIHYGGSLLSSDKNNKQKKNF